MEFQTIGKAVKETKISYLGNVLQSAKTKKNLKVNNQLTYLLYLAPSNLSGYNTCPLATHECKLGCLNTSGRVIMDIDHHNHILNSRIKKTKLFFEDRNYFMNWLVAEITKYQKKAINNDYGFSVRLNGTSDIDWTIPRLNGKNIFEIFPNVQFYDYTKIPKKFNNIPANYHLTMSYTGYNWNDCKNVLDKGYNVAVIFNIKKDQPMPKTFKGYNVINGDITDYRIADSKGIIVGLYWKKIANKLHNEQIKNSPFVVQPNSEDCVY